jgi:hypothetical protein
MLVAALATIYLCAACAYQSWRALAKKHLTSATPLVLPMDLVRKSPWVIVRLLGIFR